MKHGIVLGITGGIAAYKACELTRLIKKAGWDVRVVETENAAKFVPPLTFETLSGNRVSTDTFDHPFEIEHISLAKFADILVIAPATADIIGKIACGIADDLLSTTAMAVSCPVLIAPAMNNNMWKSAAVQANVDLLKKRGFLFVGPESGELACGDKDTGRMSEPASIFAAIKEILEPKRDLSGLKVLVTAGPTREKLDPVRFLTNRSTGKMGIAIAEEAVKRGAEVTLVLGPTSIRPNEKMNVIDVVSTQDMFEAVTEGAKNADVVIQAAAPADFTAKTVSDTKIKKTGDGMVLELVSTPDIAKTIGESKRAGQTLVCFAAETDNCLQNAQGKRKRKNADMIVLNDVTAQGAGFGTDTNIVTIISDAGEQTYPVMSKTAVANVILDSVLSIRNGEK